MHRPYQTLIVFFLTLFYILSCTADSSKPVITDITANQLQELQQQGAIVIDVRTPEEWDTTGIIPGSKKAMFFNQDMQPVENQFLKDIENITSNTDKPVVLYCRSGGRSSRAAKLLQQHNLQNRIYNLEGGIQQWLAEGNKTEK
ncbi:MAG: rhodanese-like domain-containing protein [Gammaproteobacteria bacterium]|nr:rhodanese-like domain-containing protein [Gammaproteobacteria bacterium]